MQKKISWHIFFYGGKASENKRVLKVRLNGGAKGGGAFQNLVSKIKKALLPMHKESKRGKRRGKSLGEEVL